VRMLVIDELHNVLAGNRRVSRDSCDSTPKAT